jgi:cell shape-determining protein MreC
VTRYRSAWFALWLGLVFLSLRPVAAVQRGLEILLSPLRFAAELSSPFALLRTGSVRAAERELARTAGAEAADGARILAALAARALPREPQLSAGRRFVPGEVLERLPGNQDRLLVGVRTLQGIEPGSPVACGDAYVGRVLEIHPAGDGGGNLVVEIVTAASFRVGAVVHPAGPSQAVPARSPEPVSPLPAPLSLAAEPIFLTAGGLFAARQRLPVRLAVHQPSSSALEGALARVHELFAEEGEHATLAQGFRLGTVRAEGERGPWWIEPELDFQDGLFQVVIVTRTDPAWPDALSPQAPLADERWLPARPLTSGDPAPWRSTAKLPVGRTHGVSPGAAVSAVGGRLLGRVVALGPLHSDVAWLSDPRFTLTAVAEIPGEAEPRILGRLASAGRGEDGKILLSWSVPLDHEFPGTGQRVPARLYSGSGDTGLPAGLFLGVVELPRRAAAGEHLWLEFSPGVDPSTVRTLFVRLAARRAVLP